MKKLQILLITILAIFLVSGTASATPILKISDGVNTVQITDNGAGDSNASVGAVTWIGAVGSWSTNVTTGLSFPILGSLTLPLMDLNSVDVSSSAGGTLSIWWSDNNFSSVTGSEFASLSIGGTTAGTVTYDAYADASNVLLAQTSLIDSLSFAPVSPTAFSGSGGGTITQLNGPYSLTQLVTITHQGFGQSSLDAELSVPEPATMLLLGSGLLGLALFGRKKFIKRG